MNDTLIKQEELNKIKQLILEIEENVHGGIRTTHLCPASCEYFGKSIAKIEKLKGML